MASASTSVVKDQKRDLSSGGLNVLGRTLAAALVGHDVEADLLAFDERAHPGAFNCRNVDKDIRLAVALLDEAEALTCVEKLYCSCIHDEFLSIDIDDRRLACAKRRKLRN
jgi:hypothetical protein